MTIQHKMKDKNIGYDKYRLVKPYNYYKPIYQNRDSNEQYETKSNR